MPLSSNIVKLSTGSIFRPDSDGYKVNMCYIELSFRILLYRINSVHHLRNVKVNLHVDLILFNVMNDSSVSWCWCNSRDTCMQLRELQYLLNTTLQTVYDGNLLGMSKNKLMKVLISFFRRVWMQNAMKRKNYFDSV